MAVEFGSKTRTTSSERKEDLTAASSGIAISDLPTPVARFHELAAGGAPRIVETLGIETTAWMRRPWMPRIPLEIRMAHRLGYEFVHDIRIGRGALSFRIGLDA